MRHSDRPSGVVSEAALASPRGSRIDRFLQTRRARQIERWIPDGSLLLDIGCGREAWLLRNLAGRLSHGYGIDSDCEDLSSTRLSLRKFEVGQSLPFPDSTFDCVTMLAVVEHLRFPRDVLREVFRVLKPGGALLLTTPSPSGRLLLEFLALRLGVISEADIRDHKHYFSRSELETILWDAGFPGQSVKASPYLVGLAHRVVAGKPRAAAASEPGLVSILVPVFNEQATVAELLNRVSRVDLNKEIIVVDDGSTDRTSEILATMTGVMVLRHPRNLGKGAAIRTALSQARGDVAVVQDADLEYDPEDICHLYDRYRRGGADAVFGSRVLKPGHMYSSRLYYWGGRVISLLTRLLYGANITDEPTCYKLMASALMRELDLQATGFDFCAEVTAAILRRGGHIAEVPISYRPRTREEGKKITWRDGLLTLWVLIRERVSDRRELARLSTDESATSYTRSFYAVDRDVTAILSAPLAVPSGEPAVVGRP